MNTNNSNNNKLITSNLIGDAANRNFLGIQAKFGIAQRGGSFPFSVSTLGVNRLASDINLLTPIEKKQLIFSGTIISN